MYTSLNRAGMRCARKGEPKEQLKHDYLPIFTHRSFAFLPSIAEHWATTLTSCLRTICPWLTLPYFQITLLTVLLPKAFCCLFQCPILFPCCLSHLFNLAAFSFLAAGLHTETLPFPSHMAPCTYLPSLPTPWSLAETLLLCSFTICIQPSRAVFIQLPHSPSHCHLPQKSLLHGCGPILAPVKPARALPLGVVYLIHPVCAYFSGTWSLVTLCCLPSPGTVLQVLKQIWGFDRSLKFQNSPFKKGERETA